jgi:APA family basic amino acid/polyamine antiporter
MAAFDTRPRPARIGFWMATALVVGNMIGSGIFLLPAALAPFGADNLPGWLLTAAGAVTLGLIFAQLSRAVPGAGGPYAYTREAFGDLAGFTVGWAYWVSVWVGNAAIATGAVGYLGSFVPWMVGSPLNTALTTLAFVWAFTLVNCAGIRAAGWVQGITTVLKLLPLVAAIALLMSRLGEVNWLAPAGAPYTLGGTVSVVTLTLWAMLGLESATIPADKVEGASTTVFRATMWGTVLTVVFSAAACASVLLLVPAARVASSSAPFADLATSAWGPEAAQAVSLFAAISALGALNGWTLLQGELPRAMAQDGLFPRSFAKTTTNGAPVVALLATSGVVTALVLFTVSRTLVGIFTFFVLLATTATLVAYLACALALLRLRARGRSGTSQLGLAGLALLAIVGAAYSIGAIAGAGREAVLWGAVLLLAGLPVYALLRRQTRKAAIPTGGTGRTA